MHIHQSTSSILWVRSTLLAIGDVLYWEVQEGYHCSTALWYMAPQNPPVV